MCQTGEPFINPQLRRLGALSCPAHPAPRYPTILEAMRLSTPSDTGPYELDGVSFYGPMLEGRVSRTELLHQPFNENWNAS